jgi:hypothetical protein
MTWRDESVCVQLIDGEEKVCADSEKLIERMCERLEVPKLVKPDDKRLAPLLIQQYDCSDIHVAFKGLMLERLGFSTYNTFKKPQVIYLFVRYALFKIILNILCLACLCIK